MSLLERFFDPAVDLKDLVYKITNSNQNYILLDITSQCVENESMKNLGKEIILSCISLLQQYQSDQFMKSMSLIIQGLEKNQYYKYEIFKAKQLTAQLEFQNNNFGVALKCLNSLNLEKLQLDQDDRVSFMLLNCQCYLGLNQIKDAQYQLHKCLQEVSRQKLTLEHRSIFDASLAKISEMEKKYLTAAQYYYNLSQTVQSENSIYQFGLIKKAIALGVLDHASPKRSVLLSDISKERLIEGTFLQKFLDKIVNQKIINGKEQNDFEKEVNYQLENSMIEHNILAVSKLYENISIQSLQKILEISQEQCLIQLEQLIIDDRLDAQIDQVENNIYFINGRLFNLNKKDKNAQFSQQIEIFCSKLLIQTECMKEKIKQQN